MIRRDLRLVLPLVVGLGVPSCDKKEDSSKSAPADAPAASPAPSSSAERSAEAGPRMPAIDVPDAVPADVAGVLVARTPESLFATVTSFDLLGEPEASDVDALRTELDEYLKGQIGMEVTGVDRITVFFAPKAGVAVVVEGIKGEPRGRAVGEHDGTMLYELGGVDGMVAAFHDGELLLGERDAVQAGLSAAGDGKSLADEKGPLFDLLTDDSKNVTLAAAVEVGRLPEQVKREATDVGIERAAIHYSPDGLRATALGKPDDMSALATLIKGGLSMLVSTAESEKERTLEDDDTVEAVSMIFAHHSARRLEKMLVPEVDGGTLTVEVPIRMGNPALLTAVAGAGAAIAIPAFTKYTRRAKTSEARVQIAKMFDAASAYFNEEHVDRGSVTVIGGPSIAATAPHRCPNDGRPEGSAGVTPPLSVDCSKGPGGRCVPVVGEPKGPGEYSISAWTDNDVWSGLNFQQEQGHVFHYDFRWKNDTTGFGECQFTAQAFGDLDGDGVFSTYERSGAADENGVNAAAGLYIDREVE